MTRLDLIPATLIRRYKRFLADVRLAGGRVVTAHCANPGSMRGCLADGAPAWLSSSSNPRRKLPYTLELLEIDGALIMVNTARPNHLVAEAISAGRVEALGGYEILRREVPYGDRSRIDLLLEAPDRAPCYVEVKSVSMGVGGGVSRFPDSVTARGTRHLRALRDRRARGDRAVVLFCASRDDTEVVEPADAIDPVFGQSLREAAGAGVELLAYRLQIDLVGAIAEIALGPPIEVRLPASSPFLREQDPRVVGRA